MGGRLSRLEQEAEFQNRRTRGGGEPRDRFYWLIARAYSDLDDALDAYVGRRVLVVGCAEGNVTPLARRGVQVVGVDIADQPVARLREAIEREGIGQRAQVHVMDAEALDFPNESFDAVVASGVLHHLDVERACRAWKRVLKPGGEVLLLEPLALNPLVSLYRWMTPKLRTPHEHPLAPKDFRTLRRHFARVRVQSYGLLSLASLPLSYMPASWRIRGSLLRVLDAADRVIFRLVPPIKHLGWAALIRCRDPRP